MDITLLNIFVKSVKFLGFTYRSKSCNRKNLGLSTGKHTRAVSSRQQIYLSIKRTDFVNSSAVYTLMLVLKPRTDNMLLNKIHNLVKFCLVALKSLVKLSMNCIVNREKCRITNIFIVCIKCLFNIFNAEFFNFCQDFGIGIA